MAKKRGKGGYGSENYDPETGKYIKEGDSSFHAGAEQSVKAILEDLKSGFYDEPENDVFPSKIFENDNDEETEEDEELWQQKSDMVSYLQEALDKFNTDNYMLEMNFPQMDLKKFREYGALCESRNNSQDLNAFYRGYMGAGQSAFEFNKALRFGFDKFYQMFPQYENSPTLSREAIMKRAEQLDTLTNSFMFPEKTQVYRYVDTAPIVSWFSQFNIFDGLETEKNQYGIDVFKSGYSLSDIANRMKNLIGVQVPPDKGFTSFSCVPGLSHMEKHTEETGRQFKIVYNCLPGTKAFISNYERESEGLFSRNVAFFIQDVQLQKVNTPYGEKEIVVLQYGVQR